jgi:hypothetical protein
MLPLPESGNVEDWKMIKIKIKIKIMTSSLLTGFRGLKARDSVWRSSLSEEEGWGEVGRSPRSNHIPPVNFSTETQINSTFYSQPATL